MNNADHMPGHSRTIRACIRQGTPFLAGSMLAGTCRFALAEGTDKPKVRIGLVTDLHCADKPPAGTRFYRETQPATCSSVGEKS